MFDNTYKTDVLIVGSGAAGLVAAIEAKKKGVEVLLVSKSRTGYASCSIYSGGGFTTPRGSLTEDGFFDMTVTAGEFINDQDLVEVLVKEANPRLTELERYGVEVVLDDISWPGRSFVPGEFPLAGMSFMKKLTEFARDVGVQMLESVLITSLLGDDAANGALGIDSGNRTVCINSKAVILASGGAGQIYERNDNPVQITGDGYRMALESGLQLIDMEFIQFFPTGTCEDGYPKFMIPLPNEVVQGGALRNAQGEGIAERYGLDPKLIYSVQRDAWARALAKEIFSGRGDAGSVLLDMRDLSPDIQEIFRKHYYCKAFRNFPISDKPIHIIPLAHTHLGGIPIDGSCRTSMAGLYAVGEVTGGLHGANRVGGNALTECLVFGARAGHNAAEYANSNKLTAIDEHQAYEKLSESKEISDRKPTESGDPRKVKALIQSIAWRKAGIIRSRKSLSDARESLERIAEENLPRLYGSKPREVWAAVEAINLHTVARLVTAAAMERTESRGSHYREDYPGKDERWLKHVSLRMEKGAIVTGTVPVRVTRG